MEHLILTTLVKYDLQYEREVTEISYNSKVFNSEFIHGSQSALEYFHFIHFYNFGPYYKSTVYYKIKRLAGTIIDHFRPKRALRQALITH